MTWRNASNRRIDERKRSGQRTRRSTARAAVAPWPACLKLPNGCLNHAIEVVSNFAQKETRSSGLSGAPASGFGEKAVSYCSDYSGESEKRSRAKKEQFSDFFVGDTAWHWPSNASRASRSAGTDGRSILWLPTLSGCDCFRAHRYEGVALRSSFFPVVRVTVVNRSVLYYCCIPDVPGAGNKVVADTWSSAL